MLGRMPLDSRSLRAGFCLAAGIAIAGCASPPQPATVPAAHIIYLHGAIVENEGPRARSPEFGDYDFAGIVAALQPPGAMVTAELRPKGTDPAAYADRLAAKLRRQLAESPSRITLIGASKGGIIAALVSDRLQDPRVRYVIMGSCNDWLIRTHKPRLSGRVLSIYEETDKIGHSCKPLADQSPTVATFEEVRLTNGLGHGFLYRPLPEWVGPALDWATRQ